MQAYFCLWPSCPIQPSCSPFHRWQSVESCKPSVPGSQDWKPALPLLQCIWTASWLAGWSVSHHPAPAGAKHANCIQQLWRYHDWQLMTELHCKNSHTHLYGESLRSLPLRPGARPRHPWPSLLYWCAGFADGGTTGCDRLWRPRFSNLWQSAVGSWQLARCNRQVWLGSHPALRSRSGKAWWSPCSLGTVSPGWSHRGWDLEGNFMVICGRLKMRNNTETKSVAKQFFDCAVKMSKLSIWYLEGTLHKHFRVLQSTLTVTDSVSFSAHALVVFLAFFVLLAALGLDAAASFSLSCSRQSWLSTVEEAIPSRLWCKMAVVLKVKTYRCHGGSHWLILPAGVCSHHGHTKIPLLTADVLLQTSL